MLVQYHVELYKFGFVAKPTRRVVILVTPNIFKSLLVILFNLFLYNDFVSSCGWNKINEEETDYDFPRLNSNRTSYY